MKLWTERAEQGITDSLDADRASKRLYEEAEPLHQSIRTLDAASERIYSANAQALSQERIEDAIPHFLRAIREADALPKESIKSLYNALKDCDPAAAGKILETSRLPMETRVIASANLMHNNKFVEAKTLLDEAKRLEPSIYEFKEIRMLEQHIYAGLKSQGFLFDSTPPKEAERDASGLLSAFKRNLSVFDKNKNGFVSQDEVDSAVIIDKIKGTDAHLVAVLKRLAPELRNLSNDEFGPEDNGITVKDIEELDSLNLKYMQERSRYLDLCLAREVIAKHTELPQSLKRTDVQSLIDSAKVTGREKDALNQVLRDFDDLSFLKKTNVTEIGFAAKQIAAKLNLVDSVDAVIEQSAQRLAFARDLYSSTNRLDSIKPDAVRQGHVGDCYFLAGLASLAAVNPGAIDNMIKTNSDGTYTVTFPASPKEPITVKAPTDSELSIYAEPSKFGTWVPVVEKAYGEYCNKHFYRRRIGNLTGTVSPTDATHGGTLRSGVDIFCAGGTDVDTYRVDYTALNDEVKTVRSKLIDALSNGRPVTMRNGGGRGLTALAAATPPDSDHAFGVTGFDPVTETVTVRDPAGDSPNRRAAREMPIKDFVIQFNHIAYGQQ